MMNHWEELESVIQRQTPDMDLTLVRRAYDFADMAHAGRQRRSGEPYISHPTSVAMILAEIQLDQEALAAALLHDVIEDTHFTTEDITVEFGDRVAALVDGVTKLGRVRWTTEGVHTERERVRQEEILRKMFLAMVDDVRVVLIKLADRLHNMRTLEHMPRAKQLRSALETLEVYAPLANRLGISQFKSELEDLALRYVDPQTYFSIVRALERLGVDRKRYLNRVIDELRTALTEAGMTAEISGRQKHITSIVRKMERGGVNFDEIYDVLGIRVIIDEKKDCYNALGVIHSIWHPIPGEFDDYIATPKEGVYQSIHTSVLGPEGHAVEIQIRTQEMHHVAEYGIAAHWRYKEGSKPDPNVEAKVAWLRQLMDWHDEIVDADEFIESLKSDVFQEMIYVFTPKGDIIELPAGATPVDFAYRIHTEVGHLCVGSKVNGHLVPLNYALQNGEVVQVMTLKSKVGPSRDWLLTSSGFITTKSARRKMRTWFRHHEREDLVLRGRDTLERELRNAGLDSGIAEIARQFPSYKRVDDLLVAIGDGSVTPGQIRSRLDMHEYCEVLCGAGQEITTKLPPSLQVPGVGDLYTRLASCCKPVYGDAIIGYVTRGRSITVHRSDCHNVAHVDDPDRLVEASWGTEQRQLYPVNVRLEAWDRVGLLRDITALMLGEKLNVLSVLVSVNDDRTVTVVINFEVYTVVQLNRTIGQLEKLREVYDVRRADTDESKSILPNS